MSNSLDDLKIVLVLIVSGIFLLVLVFLSYDIMF